MKTIALRVAGIVLAFAATAALAAPQLLRPVPPSQAMSSTGGSVAQPGVATQFNAEEMHRLAPGAEVELALPDGTSHPYIFELGTDHGTGIKSWVGQHRDLGNAYRVIVTSGPNGTFARFTTPRGEFRLLPGPGHDWLVDMSQHDTLIDLGNDVLVPPAEALRKSAGSFNKPELVAAIPGVNVPLKSAKVTPTPQAVVDLMLVYTTGLKNRLGANLTTRLNYLVTVANTAFVDSEVAITLRLVHAMEVNYTDANDNLTALENATPTRPTYLAATFGPVEAQRNAIGADIVAILRDGQSFGGGGIAWLGSKVPNPNFMYSVTTGCVAGCESVFVHEVGHNMGNSHDRATAAWQDGGGMDYQPPIAQFWPYAYGYPRCVPATLACNPFITNGTFGACPANQQPECADPGNVQNFADLMSYFHGSTQQNYKFSNPNVGCAGTNGILAPCGVAHVGDDLTPSTTSADTARSMNNNRVNLSAIKPTVIASSLQLTSSTYVAYEGSGASVLVSRVGGSSGAASVNYTVVSGSAQAGIDFPVTTGTLTWADGDAASKGIPIAIFLDNVVENTETFTITLSNPSGPTGTLLGSPSTATVAIPGPFPPGNVMPAGWHSSGTPATPWTVGNDSFFEGSSSLRSHNVLGSDPINHGTFVNSDLTTPFAVYPAGNVDFAYNVSAYPEFGYLEFFVDGVLVFSTTDTFDPMTLAQWRFASIPIPAGVHSFTWRFKNALGFPCGFTSPAPPRGTQCADRAWIDAVSFPTTLPATSVSVVSSPNPTTPGQMITFTATVTGASGAGAVAFFANGTQIPCSWVTLTGTTAQCTNQLPAGTHAITAAYSGTAALAGSLSTAATHTVLSTQTLTVIKAGAGTGTVTSSPAGINCGATCSATVSAGAMSLTATANAGSVFTGWSAGPCSAAAGCQFTLLQPTTLTANFALASGTPAVAMTQPSIAFSAQSMGTTTPVQTISLVNVGTGTVNISGIATSGPQFTVVHNCASFLNQGDQCLLQVTATPAAVAGALLSTATVNGNVTATTSAGNAVTTLSVTGEKSLVTHYYRSILRRAPDGGGKAFWDSEAVRMQGQGANVNETWYSMATFFYTSAEYLAFGRDNVGFVTDLYNTFFNRPPDGGGLSFWVAQLSMGMPREVVLVSFMFSTEFTTFAQGIFGNTAVRAEVDVVGDFYRGLLSRLADGGGFGFWIGQFRAAQCLNAGAVYTQAETISSSFANGAEYAARARSNSQYVGDLYNSFLRRGGDLAGVQFWINQLNTAALTRNQVRQQFIASGEFNGRVAAIIAQGCVP